MAGLELFKGLIGVIGGCRRIAALSGWSGSLPRRGPEPSSSRGVGMVAGALELRVAALSLLSGRGGLWLGHEPRGWLGLRPGLGF